jgi:hypothetical protein
MIKIMGSCIEIEGICIEIVCGIIYIMIIDHPTPHGFIRGSATATLHPPHGFIRGLATATLHPPHGFIRGYDLSHATSTPRIHPWV